MNPDIERLLALVAKTSQGIGEKIIITRILQESVAETGKLYERREGSIEEGGEIKDLVEQNVRLFSCGCAANTKTLGSVCSSPIHIYRTLPVLNKDMPSSTPFICCKKCIKRCIRCKKLFCLFCITTVSSLPGVVFCKSCARARKWDDFFGFFLGRR